MNTIHKFIISSQHSYKFSTRRERDINAATSACQNVDSDSSLTLLEVIARLAHRLSNLSIPPGDIYYNAASLAGLADFMGIFMFVTSPIQNACTFAAILTITHAAKQTRRAAASRLISTLSASGGVWIYRT